MSLVRGNHQWSLGGAILWIDSNSNAHVWSPGTFNFNGRHTGTAMADFLLGRVNSMNQAAPNTNYVRKWYAGLFLADSWRMTPQLTMNYGVRWEPDLAETLTLGRIVEDKGIAYLVRAFRELGDPDARLLLGGNYRTVAGGGNLAAIQAEIGSDPRILVLGELRGNETVSFLRAINNSELQLAVISPYPVAHCALCGYSEHCEERWDAEDHPSLIAGSSRAIAADSIVEIVRNHAITRPRAAARPRRVKCARLQ